MSTQAETSQPSYEQWDDAPAEKVLEWALGTLHPRLALASSFGAEDMVVLDMMQRIRKDARVFTLDTWRLHAETYDLLRRAESKYGVRVERMEPQREAVEKMVAERGLNLFYDSVENRKLCCGIRKVEPLGRALSGLDAWITGLRRDQAATRASVHKVEVDSGNRGILKINPLADWSSERVWEYIREHDVPYNALHDRGFPSIGCEPCTRAVKPGEDPRAGRWWWEQNAGQKECGLHVGQAPTPPTDR